MDSNYLNLLINFGIGVLGVLGALCAFWAKFARYQQKVDHLEEEKVKVNAALDGFRTDIGKLRPDVAILNEFKVQTQRFMDQYVYKTASPLSLTELGQRLVTESGFEQIFQTEKENLAALLEEKHHPETKYDTQERARELMDGLQRYPAFASIKTYAYESGNDFGQILRAGGILLRDYYLSIHPEIKN